MGLFTTVSMAQLRVPQNSSAPSSRLLLAPEWLFSHFPWGAFFPSFQQVAPHPVVREGRYRICHALQMDSVRAAQALHGLGLYSPLWFSQCHDDSWKWRKASALEQRLCMPNFRVPVVMVHMAGLRNGQWGRRGVMRALGVWHEEADSVSACALTRAGQRRDRRRPSTVGMRRLNHMPQRMIPFSEFANRNIVHVYCVNVVIQSPLNRKVIFREPCYQGSRVTKSDVCFIVCLLTPS